MKWLKNPKQYQLVSTYKRRVGPCFERETDRTFQLSWASLKTDIPTLELGRVKGFRAR